MTWQRDKARFEPYLYRFDDGRISYANAMTGWRSNPFRFHRKTWPVRRFYSVRAHLASASITRMSKVCAARRWIPENPLFVHLMAVQDAFLVRKGQKKGEGIYPAKGRFLPF